MIEMVSDDVKQNDKTQLELRWNRSGLSVCVQVEG